MGPFFLIPFFLIHRRVPLKGQGKISRREALILQRENAAMIIINVTIRYTLPTKLRTANVVIIIVNVTIRYVLPTKLQRESAMIIINVTFRYVLPTRLQRANAVIIINVTFRYVLPTRLQRANAVIIIKCNRQVYSTLEVTESQMQ